MVRPVFLIVELEPREGISARKLVLESDKYNVITCYSASEAKDTLDQFPGVTAVVAHADVKGVEAFTRYVKKSVPQKPLIVLSPNPAQQRPAADHHVSSHDPQELVGLLRSMYPDSR